MRDRLQNISPVFYQLIKSTYKTQLRNSIAHSNYSFLGRNIHPNNYIENDKSAQLKYVTFDEWIDIFHQTLSFHNQYIVLDNMINDHFSRIALANGNQLQIRITEADGKQYLQTVIYRPEWNDWRFKQPNEK